jgi:hypothetical protein
MTLYLTLGFENTQQDQKVILVTKGVRVYREFCAVGYTIQGQDRTLELGELNSFVSKISSNFKIPLVCNF